MSAILFDNVAIFDGSGALPYPAWVRVEGDVIAATGRDGQPPAAGDALRIDGAGSTLMPGLIDAHAHLALGSTIEAITPPGNRTDAETALLVAHCGRVLLDHGFTGAFSGGAGAPAAEVAAAKAFQRGILPGPRLRSASFERTPGGEMGLKTSFEGIAQRPASPADAAAFVDEMADLKVDSVKFLLAGVSAFDPGSNLRMQFHASEIAAAAERARQRDVWLIAHAYTPEAIALAVKNGFRLIYHCSWADEASLDLIEANKDRLFIGPAPGITEADLLVAPNFGVMASPAQREEQAEAVERLKWVGNQLRRRGIRSLPGGDYGFPWNPIGRNGRDLQLFVEWFGYSPAEALHAATQQAGELMALEKPLGVVAPGAYADLLLVRGDPTAAIGLLADRANIDAIMTAGRLYKAPPQRD